jgi:hypothetical protein
LRAKVDVWFRRKQTYIKKRSHKEAGKPVRSKTVLAIVFWSDNGIQRDSGAVGRVCSARRRSEENGEYP